MSSLGQIAGGVVGGIVGFFAGNPLYGAQIGMMIGGAIDPPKGPTINGPRLSDLSVQTSTYGAFIPRNYGTMAQTGNVFWVQGDKLIEEITSTTSGGKGGPTTTTNTASYYATFAVGLCEGPIDGVRRIWIGNQLWYDAGSSDITAIIASNHKVTGFTLYLGTDTQLPDPLIQADKGAANVPAYRGLAYIVFDRLPLDVYSNSLMAAQVKVEIVKDGSYSAWAVTSDNNLTSDIVGGERRSVTYSDDEAFYEWTVDTIGTSPVPSTFTEWRIDHVTKDRVPVVSVSADLDFLYAYYDDPYARLTCIGYGDVHALAVSVDTGTTRGLAIIYASSRVDYYFPPNDSWEGIAFYCFVDGILAYASSHHGFAPPYDKHLVIHDRITGVSTEYDFPTATAVIRGIAISNNKVFVCSSTNVYIFDLASRTFTTNSTFASFTGLVSSNGGVDVWSGDPQTNYLHFNENNILYGLDTDTNAIFTVCTSNNSFLTGGRTRLFRNVGDGVVLCRRIPLTPSVYGTFHLVHTKNRVTSSSTTLGDIVQAECLTSSQIDSGDLDVTELTDTVRGYRITSLGAIRGGLDPLRAAFPFDVVQHGYKIKFKRRGSSSVATIASSELDARAAGESPGVQITTVREMDGMLPRKVSVNYVDVTREYETNQQYYERLNTDSVSEKSIDMPIVFNGTEAAQNAETLLYLYWMERYDVSLRLPPTYAHLEPGDVIAVTSPAADYELRLTSINTLPDGRLECAAKFNRNALYTPTSIGEEGKSTGGLLSLDGACIYSLLDVPLMRDDDDTAGFPAAMAGYRIGWSGGVLYRSDDNNQTWNDIRAFTPGAIIGYAPSVLSAHGGTVFDFASTLTVWLYYGALASVTEAQLFAGQNWFAYGADGRWEIIAARIATLQGDGSYILQDLLRGQYGTEWATGLHAANDRIILLDTANIAFISVNSSTIGAARNYRGITTGKAIDSDSSITFTYRGVNLECLSPIHLTGSRHPSTHDWTLNWTRRSRYNQWRDYVDAPLGESSESYEIEIYSSSAYTTLKRTLSASTPTVAYTSAQQVTDFGANQSTLYLKLYQLSSTVGRGYALTQSITR